MNAAEYSPKALDDLKSIYMVYYRHASDGIRVERILHAARDTEAFYE
ncbi:MAG TPA: hypothetical protein PK867_13860 [Pirellulales bacterium]|nr:hypothetical protein [Pirellulales bacterium]